MFIYIVFIAILVYIVSVPVRIHHANLQDIKVDAWIQYLESRVSKLEKYNIYPAEPEPDYNNLAAEFINLIR